MKQAFRWFKNFWDCSFLWEVVVKQPPVIKINRKKFIASSNLLIIPCFIRQNDRRETSFLLIQEYLRLQLSVGSWLHATTVISIYAQDEQRKIHCVFESSDPSLLHTAKWSSNFQLSDSMKVFKISCFCAMLRAFFICAWLAPECCEDCEGESSDAV